MYTSLLMQIFNQPIMWQQLNAEKHFTMSSLQKFSQPMKAKRLPVRSMMAQKETGVLGPGSRWKSVLLVDAAQQTGL